MKSMAKKISAGEFKAKCLHLMDQVNKQKIPIIITKRGVPVAQLAPVKSESKPKLFGYLKNSVAITSDIIAPINETWDAEQ